MKISNFQLTIGLAAALTLSTIGCGGSGSSVGRTTTSAGKFTQVNLVGDTAGAAAVTDASLVNPWGISFSPTGAFWVSDNGTGLSTLYNGTGAKQGLTVTIPAAGGATNGPVDGQLFNSTTDFVIPGSTPAIFIFSSEDGLITGWNGGTTAVTVADRSATGAVYKAIAMASNGGANFLYATNFNSGSVDVFDANYAYTTSFTDTTVPTGYAPFGIANIGGQLYVSFAKQNSQKHDDVAGPGNGFVDVFSPSGTLVRRLVSGGALNSPWAMVVAPSGFGSLGGALLVGNFGDGHINAYNATTGASLGALSNAQGAALVIPGLWGLIFGNGGAGGSTGTLYFTAGPGGESHGLFGSLAPTP